MAIDACKLANTHSVSTDLALPVQEPEAISWRKVISRFVLAARSWSSKDRTPAWLTKAVRTSLEVECEANREVQHAVENQTLIAC